MFKFIIAPTPFEQFRLNIIYLDNGTVASHGISKLSSVLEVENMITSLDLLNRLKVEKQLLSNRQVAVFLGINHMTVNRIVNGGVWSDEMACFIAQELGLDVDLVLLAIISERCKNDRVTEAIESALEKRNTG